MGVGTWSRQYNEIVDPEFNPNIDEPASYPTNYGFSGERVERKMIATEDEMVKAKVPLKHRDYCAHYYINFLKCNRPWGFGFLGLRPRKARLGALSVRRLRDEDEGIRARTVSCSKRKGATGEEEDDRGSQTGGSLDKQVTLAPSTLIEIKG